MEHRAAPWNARDFAVTVFFPIRREAESGARAIALCEREPRARSKFSALHAAFSMAKELLVPCRILSVKEEEP